MKPKDETQISFGTDGWRGVIARDFTFENVAKVAQAVADYLKEDNSLKERGCLIAYDARFLSEMFAKETVQVLAANDIKCFLTEEDCPTPAASFYIKNQALGGGIVITASHNPFYYNGIKFKPYYGGSASKIITDKLEEKLSLVKTINKIDLSQATKKQLLITVNPANDYLVQLLTFVEPQHIQSAKLKVIIDPMHGSGRKYLEEILNKVSCEVINIAPNRDTLFGGRNPEPIIPHIAGLLRTVPKEKADIGLAIDGDADRIGAVDEQGRFLNSHRIFALLLYYLFNYKEMTGAVARSVCTSFQIDRLAKKYGLKLFETKVGFKNICDLMLEEDILIGGEESGGIGFKGHIPERDGILCGLLLVEMVACLGKPLGKIYDELNTEFGDFYYLRRDLILNVNGKQILDKIQNKNLSKVANFKVAKINSIDGLKFELEDDRWLMLRASGTEPLIRIYAEGRTQEETANLIRFGEEIINID